MKPNCCDIFIPACQRDAEQLGFLATSLASKADPDSIHRLIICQVSEALETSARKAVLVSLGPLAQKTEFIRESDLGLKPIQNGWLNQQAAKLAFSSQAQTRYYLVLDAKNILLQAIDLCSLIVDNKAPIKTSSLAAHPKWWRGSAWALGCNDLIHPSCADQGVLSSVPPVFIHAKSCYGLISYIKGKFRQDIGRFMAQKRPIRHRLMRPSEFTLYYTWLHKEDLLVRMHYLMDSLQCNNLIWGRHSQFELEERLSQILAPSQQCLFSGIHWRAWNRLSNSQKKSLYQVLSTS